MKSGLNEGANWLLAFGHLGLGAIAGAMKEVNKIQSSRFSLKNLIAGSAVAAFVAFVAYLLLGGFSINGNLVAAITGIAGWMGGNLMDFFGQALKKMISKKLGITATNDTNLHE